MSTHAGTILAINRYPVKSMQAEPLEEADLHWTWLLGDRQYAFVKESNSSAFPWLTARDVPELVRYRARYDAAGPVRGTVIVTAPDGAAYDVRDPALAARLGDAAGTAVRLLRLGRGCFDAMPVSILTTAMAEAVARAHGADLGTARFRANIVIAGADPAATEQDWVGHHLTLGEGAGVTVGWPTPRCAMVAIDAETAARDPGVVRTVAQQFQNRVGAYCSVRAPGTVQVGDAVVRIG